jgi:PAS domain S-box-containing protein
LGLSSDERLGKNIFEQVHPDDLEHAKSHFAQLLERPEAKVIIQARSLHGDGTWHWIEAMANNLLNEPSVQAIVLNYRDITERKRAELLQGAVYQISQATDKAANLNDLYKSVHEIISTVMPAKNFYISLYDDNKGLLSFPYFIDEVDVPSPPSQLGKGLTEYVLRTGKPLLCDEARDMELRRRGEVELVGAPSSIWLGVPLIVENKTLGVMAVQHYSDPKAYGQRELEMLEYVSSQVAKAIEKKRAEDALRESVARYRTLVETSPDAITLTDLGSKILICNQQCAAIHGFETPEEMIGKSAFDLIAPEDRARAVENARRTVEEGGIRNVKYLFLKADGDSFPAELNASVIKDVQGNPEAFIGITRDITQQKKAEKIKDSIYKISEAAHSAQNLEELFSSIHGIIGELMPAKNFYIALYDSDREILSFPYFADEYDEAPAPKRLGKGLTEYVLRTGEPLLASPEVFEELVKKGEAELIGAPSIDWLGVPLKTDNKTYGVLVVQSYTEGVRFGKEDKEILKFVSGQTAMAIRRKHAEEQLRESLREKEVLLKEVHHRVKNNMQIISSLLNLQASQMKDNDFIKMVKDSQNRIRSIALVHEKLYRSQDISNINFSDYVQSLVIHLFQVNQAKPNLVELKMNLEDVFLDIRTAIPCGLILNELVTNSLKHAFPNGRSGEIIVELHPLEEHTCQIIVRDNGVGIPQDLDMGNPPTLGWQIVTMLVRQIEGSLEVQKEGGTTVKILFKKLK